MSPLFGRKVGAPALEHAGEGSAGNAEHAGGTLTVSIGGAEDAQHVVTFHIR
jgi:hypothetical protein